MSSQMPPASHSRVVKISEEDHTLGTTLVTALWTRPQVMVAQYAQEHTVERGELSIHCQTDGRVAETTSLQEAVMLTKSMLTSLGLKMDEALQDWEKLPDGEQVAMNKRGVLALAAQMAAAEEDLRQSRLDDERADLDGDNPFRRIVRDADSRRRRAR